ncbi:MAG: hypothetical protein AB8G05_06020 [Oligoflexales bacterium]
MEGAKSYKIRIDQQIDQELSKPSEVKFPSLIDRRNRAGINIAYDFLQLCKSINDEISLKRQVDLAYELILKRPSDHQGSQVNQEILKNNGLTALIAQLRYSDEGRKKNTPIKGLFVPYMKYRLKHWLSMTTR